MFCYKCGAQNADEAKFCQTCGQSLQPAAAVAAPSHYAGFWRRFVAVIIDGLILSIPQMILFGLFFVSSLSAIISAAESGDAAAIISMLGGAIKMAVLGAIIKWLYFALFESSTLQATPGKMAISIVVTDLDGKRISFGRATGRHFGKILSSVILLIGYIMAGITEKKQALHDMLAGTLVVCKP